MKRLAFVRDLEQWKRGIKAGLITFGVLFLLHENVGILINRTGSLPQKVFLHLKTWPAKKGNYTVIRHDFYPFPLIKQIKGHAGDRLHYADAQELELLLNEEKIGCPHTLGSHGQPLTPIAAQVIPQGFVFLGASHPKSFDSRYAEMGLIHTRALQGRAVPLW
jgi:conjugal transfer pilin signal peptidase TrbI